MQSRRHEDFASQSSFDRGHRNTDVRPDSYMTMSPHSKRNWSSKMEGPAYSERVMAGRRSVSLERREFDDVRRRVRSRSPNYAEVNRGRSLYDDDLVADRGIRSPGRRSIYGFIDRMEGKREGVACSPKRKEFGNGPGGSLRTGIMEDKFEIRNRVMRTPERRSRHEFIDRMDMKRETFEFSPKRNEFGYSRGGSSRTGLMEDKVESRNTELHTPEWRLRYEFIDRMDRKREGVDCSPKRNEFSYGHGGSSRTGVMEDKFETRRLVGGMREIGSQKSAGIEMYRSTGDVGPISRTITGEDILSTSVNVGLGQLGKERVQYPDVRDPILFDKYTGMKQYEDVEKHMVDSRDALYSNMTSSSRSKEYMDASNYKDYTRTSPRNSRVDHLGYRGDIPLTRDNHPLNSARIPEQPLSHSRYEHSLDTRRTDLPRDNPTDLLIREDMARYRKDRLSPPRTGNLDSMRLSPRTRERGDYLYPSDEIYENVNLRERVDYNARDVLKPRLLDPVTQRTEPSEFARMNMSGRSSLDHHSIEKLARDDIGLRRSPSEKRESTQYLDSDSIHSRLGRRILREHEMPYMGMSQDREMERVREDYDYNYDYKESLRPGSHRERRRSPEGVLFESERRMERRDFSPYDSSSRFLKRKYTMDEEENRFTSRPLMSRLDTVNRRYNRDVIDEEWIDNEARGSSYPKRRDNTREFNTRLDKVYEDEDFSFHDHDDEFMHDRPLKSYKYEDNYARSGGRDGYNSYHPNRRNVLPKRKNVHINSEDNKADSSEIKKYEPHDDSDEFKKLVHDYFLSFTKKLNENPSVRRRYMEQGRAGSLFCMVCGRSASKEFMDTQRLAMHAFMSHKGGLRAQHLGLLKAICVMLGWNSVIPAWNIGWFPDPLSSTETYVQKSDLIIWPPVIIVHNTSISNNDSNGQGPTTVEALGQFLRGVGLSGGKVKHGKHANGSIMLVTFLGTFTALQEAEKIHKYFSKNKHGRKDLDRISSSKGKSSNNEEGETRNKDKEAERVLYGYMAIAEDLDKVDPDTKRKCSIKSKKEIKDLADGPVKPE